MDFGSIDFWFYSFQIWLIAGVILLGIEMMDGSKIFFLPLGVSAGLIGGFLFLVEQNLMPDGLVPSKWYGLLFFWAVIGVAVSFALKYYQKKDDQDQGDVNQY